MCIIARRCLWCVVCVAVLLSAATPAAAQIALSDDRGQRIVLPRPAQRIVSLAPHVTELLFAAGAGDKVVGVSAFSDFPVRAQRLPVVAAGGRVDYERIVALAPDLVIAWGSGTTAAAVAELERLGFPVFASEPRHLEDIAASLRRFGRLAGSEAAAQVAAAEFEQTRAALAQAYADRDPVSVFLQIERRPLMTLNGAHVASDVLALCGGINVFAELGSLAPSIDRESVIARNPQAILVSDTIAGAQEAVAEWRGMTMLHAARSNQVYLVASDLIVRHTPRILAGAQKVCSILDRVRESG